MLRPLLLPVLLLIAGFSSTAFGWGGVLTSPLFGYPAGLDAEQEQKAQEVLKLVHEELIFLEGSFINEYQHHRFGGSSQQTSRFVKLLKNAGAWKASVQFHDFGEQETAFTINEIVGSEQVQVTVNSAREDFSLRDFRSYVQLTQPPAKAEAPPATEMLTIASEDFNDADRGLDNWEILDSPANWSITQIDGNGVLRQEEVNEDYQPPHRSPLHVALLKNSYVTDLVLTARVKSTVGGDNPHRDACLFFGYQNDAHFYYVHLGLKSDPHANQIFIVNGADRKMITLKQSKGTPWDDQWHDVKVVRRVGDGMIEIYFDDMKSPVMTAKDDNFKWGRVGVGSFDDTNQWDNVVLKGKLAKPPVDHVDPIKTPALNGSGVTPRR